MNHKNLTRVNSSMKRLIPPCFVLLLIVFMMILHNYLPILTIIPAGYRRIGSMLLLPGLWMSFSASRQFSREKTSIDTFGEPEKLITNGWFRFTRNPIYLGYASSISGVWIMTGSLSPLVGIIIFFLVSNLYYIPYEEHAMNIRFGSEFEKYKKRVRKWL